MNDTRITQILQGLSAHNENYKQAELEAAVELQEEITPFLIEILEKVAAAPATYVANFNYDAHVYALILLTHFKEQAAHRVIIDLFSLPPKMPERLFEDHVNETLPTVLLRTYPGSSDFIKSLIVNKQASDNCRGSAAKALIYLATAGLIEREELLSFFATLFTGNEAAPDSPFWSFLASYVYDFYPEELMHVIEKAYQDDLILLWFISPKEFHQQLKKGRAQVLGELKAKVERELGDDVHYYLSGWNGFKHKIPPLNLDVPPVAILISPPAAPPVVAPVSLPKKKPTAKAGVPKSHKKTRRKKKGKKGGSRKKKRR